ncbi:MAG: hypothetical protein ABSG08_18900 [Terriglobales bacterium]|jgi:hypothetical protein
MDPIMKTIRVRGVVGSEKESLDWDVYVDLCLDDDDKMVDYQQVEFGAAPPPPTGDYKLIFFHGGQQHEAHGHIERQTWQRAVFGSKLHELSGVSHGKE